MKKKVRNYIIAGVVVVLGLITCAIAINMGGQQQMMQGDMGDSYMDMDESNPVAGEVVEMNTKDLEGNDIDSSIFKNYELTIMNLWSPTCGPCVEEMPEIQKLQDEYKDRIKVLGVLEEYDLSGADDILIEQNITYTNIVAGENLQKITNQFMYIPVTLFVNSDGEILDTFIPGSTDYETFKAMVDELINNK